MVVAIHFQLKSVFLRCALSAFHATAGLPACNPFISHFLEYLLFSPLTAAPSRPNLSRVFVSQFRGATRSFYSLRRPPLFATTGATALARVFDPDANAAALCIELV